MAKQEPSTSRPRVVTTKTVLRMKETGEKIAMPTAYDYLVAKYLDQVGIDVILVGDSLGNVVQGHETTLPVTVDDMMYHAKAVKRAVKNALIVVDMPFMSYQTSVDDAVRNCGRVMKEVGVGAVKLEGGEYIAEIVRHLVKIGIPVMGHLGLTPQSVSALGGFRVQGKDAARAKKIVDDAKTLENAGATSILFEMIPDRLQQIITERANIPIISLGSGPYAHGQLLIFHDMFGLYPRFKPKMAKVFGNAGEVILNGLKQYVAEVTGGQFPQSDNWFGMKDDEFEELKAMLD